MSERRILERLLRVRPNRRHRSEPIRKVWPALGAALAATVGVPSVAAAYTVGVHVELTERAFVASVLSQSGFRQSIGLTNVNYSAGSCGTATIVNIIACGAVREDDLIRSINHFFDPQRSEIVGSGVPGSYSSPDWILEDTTVVSGQDYSYRDARRLYFEALTASTSSASSAKFGEMLRALGHVVHHLQDMAQPQHVRNDLHCDAAVCAAFDGFTSLPGALPPSTPPETLYDPSIIEGHAGTRLRSGQLNIGTFGPVSGPTLGGRPYVHFPTPRQYWTASASNSGIANFTSLNFLSEDTNFAWSSTSGIVVSPPNPHPSPGPSGTLTYSISSAELGVPGPAAPMRFLRYAFVDPFTNQSQTNQRLSTFSIFSDHLERLPGGRTAFSFSRYNVDEVLRLSLPRAVAFSSGLIDYFFRGSLELVPPATNNKAVWRLRNTGAERLQGEVQIVGFYEDGQRLSPVSRTVDLDPGELIELSNAQPFSIGSWSSFDTTTFENKAIVAFRGRMGQEGVVSPTATTFNAVAGRLQNVPAPPQFSVQLTATGSFGLRLRWGVPPSEVAVVIGPGQSASIPIAFWPRSIGTFPLVDPSIPATDVAFGSVSLDCLATGQGFCQYQVSFSTNMAPTNTVNLFDSTILFPPPLSGFMRGPSSSIQDYPSTSVWFLRYVGGWPN